MYLPFRITETTTVPNGETRSGRSSSAPFANNNSPLEGEPPVERYPNASLNSTGEHPSELLQLLQSFNPQTDSHERLCNAVEHLLEQGATLSEVILFVLANIDKGSGYNSISSSPCYYSCY